MATVSLDTYWMRDPTGNPIKVYGSYNGAGWHIIGYGIRRMGVDVFLTRENAEEGGDAECEKPQARVPSRGFNAACNSVPKGGDA